MKIVVVKTPKLLTGIFRLVFKVKRAEPESDQKTFQYAGSIGNFDGFLTNYFILDILSCLIFGTSFAKLYGG